MEVGSSPRLALVTVTPCAAAARVRAQGEQDKDLMYTKKVKSQLIAAPPTTEVPADDTFQTMTREEFNTAERPVAAAAAEEEPVRRTQPPPPPRPPPPARAERV